MVGVAGLNHLEVDIGLVEKDDAQRPSVLVFLHPFDADGFAADQGREIGRRFLGARVSGTNDTQ